MVPFFNRRYSLQVTLPRAKFEHPSQNGHENDNEDSMSEIEVENIVGVGSSAELEVLYSKNNMHCLLMPINGVVIFNHLVSFRKWNPLLIFSAIYALIKSRRFIG